VPLDVNNDRMSTQLDSTLPGFSDKITSKQMVEKFKMSYEKDLLLFQQMLEKNQIPQQKTPGMKRSEASEAKAKPPSDVKDHFFITETRQSKNMMSDFQNDNFAEIVNRLNDKVFTDNKLLVDERKETEYDSYIVDEDTEPIDMNKTVTEVSNTIDLGSQNLVSYLAGQKIREDRNRLNLTEKESDLQIDSISKPLNMNFLDNLRVQMEQSEVDAKSLQPSPSQLVNIEFDNESELAVIPQNSQLKLIKPSPNKKDSFDDDMFISNYSLDPEEKVRIQEELRIEDSLLKTDFYTIKERTHAELNTIGKSKSVANRLDFNEAISHKPDIQNTALSNPLSVLASPISQLAFKRPASSGLKHPNIDGATGDNAKFMKQKASSNVVINFDNYSNYKNTINPLSSEQSLMKESDLKMESLEGLINLENSGTNFLQKNKEVLNKFDDFFKRSKANKDTKNSFEPRIGMGRFSQNYGEQLDDSYNSREFDRIFKNSDQKNESKKSLIRYNQY
jgi:hypothetical protein